MKDKHKEETQKRGAPWKDDGRARLTVDGVSNNISSHSIHAFRHAEDADYDRDLSEVSIHVNSLSENSIEFDIKGMDASLVNAFRRILLAEVPTVAIEKVLIADNTSIIADEVLSHRLGLIPINVDPRLLQDGVNAKRRSDETNTVIFRLNVCCRQNQDGSIENDKVYSSHLEWLPEGSQFLNAGEQQNVYYNNDEDSEMMQPPKTYTEFSKSQKEIFPNGVSAVHDDILIAKLCPGQRIELEAHAVKGIGKEHAKWSPVATAFYRMLPEIVLKEEIANEDAETLMAKCGGEVFEIQHVQGKKVIVVANPRNYHLCQHCLLDPKFANAIQINKIRDHFIFTIESTGALKPEVLFEEALRVLIKKCEVAMEGIDSI